MSARRAGSRLFVTGAALLALVLPVGPAFAQTGCDIRLGGVSNGQTLSGGVNLRATGASSTGVRRLELSVNGGVLKAASFDGLQQNAAIDAGWNPSGGRNGEYTVKASGSCGNGSNDATAKVYVDNAPQSPNGISANYSDGAIHVSWSPNSEPDLQGYRVERDGGSGWQNAGEVGGTSFSDAPGSGTFSYRVIALRFSPTQGTKASAPSGTASATVPAAAVDPGTAPGEPSTGTETGSGTGSGSGSGAGSGSGSGSGNGNGNSLPGYGGNKGSKGSGGHGSNGGDGSVGGYGGFFGGRSIGGIGLPGSLRLPGRGSSAAPAVPAAQEDGTYDPFLPYELGGTAATGPKTTLESFGTAALSPFRVIPPDAARWVAAGLWFLVTAALLKFLERQVAKREEAEAAGATVTELVPATSVEDAAPAVAAMETETVPAVAEAVAPAARVKCAALTKAGNACRNYSVTSAGYCRAHAAHERTAETASSDIGSEEVGLRLVKDGDAA